LRAALRRLVEPLAVNAGFALCVQSEDSRDWICGHDDCLCDRAPVDSLLEIERVARIEAFHRDIPAGFVILCAHRGDASLFPIACNLIAESIRQVELEFEDEDLIRELGSNWESLHTIYEISSDLRTSRNIPDILGGILDRIVAGRQNLHAVLWVEREGRLEPAVSKRAEVSTARNIHSGILGRAVINRAPIVISDRSKIQISADLEPELSHAERIALMPITTRDRLIGVLEVWQNDGVGEFDTPIIRLFEALALQAAMVIESERAYRISLAEERLRREFEIGGKIQETLLSGRPPAALPGVRIGVLTVPSHAVDGDFFDFLSCGEDCLDVFVGDVMGKGIPAALVGAAAKSDLLRAFGQLTAANLTRQLPAPKDIITSVHQHLTTQLIDIESFISLYYSRFDLRKRRMDFVDCGHPRAIHYRAATGTLELLTGDNMPLGVLEEESYSQASVSFSPGDVFLFYSDGVTDAHNMEGKLYGEERLKSCMFANAGLEPADLCIRIRESVSEFTGSQMVTDDLTCLSVKIGSLDERLPSTRWTMEFLGYLEFLPALRAWIRGVCRCACADDSSAADSLELAVTETASNIIRHAYEGQTGKKINIEVQAYADRMEITITHWGKRFRPETASTQTPDASAGHGYGLYIISRLMDNISYFDSPYGANCVTLEKLLHKTAGGDICMLARIEKIDDVTVIRVALDTLDAGNEKRFKNEVISVLEPKSKVVLDMGEVDFIDSSGLGVILSCYRHLQSSGGDLKLCCLNNQVRMLFELVRMHRIYDIYATREEALTSFSQQA
jgi:phosphoserine phosphatase RsbU/P